MDPQGPQVHPAEVIKHAKKHPHTHTISTQAFTVLGKDYVIHNLAMKGDPQNDFDVANYRRGLAVLEEIINFKEGPPRIAKKGLRKFNDLMPEYLETKKNNLTGNKYHLGIKNRILNPLQSAKAQEFIIYSSEKANGENAQISWDQQGGFWVIGSKNKTLLLSQEKDKKYITNKFEHVRTIGIADLWFKILENAGEKIDQIKSKLSEYTLVGEICDSVKSGHIVDYGTEPKLFFYALVNKKQQIYSCEPPSVLIDFLKSTNLSQYGVKFDIKPVKTYEALHDELKKQVQRVFQATIEDAGEGIVLYISTIDADKNQICESVCKIKTLQYRIYRKLRQKLKTFFQKVRKSYDKNLNKFNEEVKELVRHFSTPKPLEYYFGIAKKAFELCENQEKAVLKFISNKFISFIKLLQNENIDKKAFMEVVYDSSSLDKVLQKVGNTSSQGLISKQGQGEQKIDSKPVQKGKNVLVLVPMTIPSTGKSSLFKKIQQKTTDFGIHILSSDKVRDEVMQEKMKRQKSLTKKAAFEKSRKQANERYYKYMGEIFNKMAKQTQHSNFVFLLDKNHPENALKTTIQQIKQKSSKHKDLNIKIIVVLPLCNKTIENKPKYMYPFSSCYIATCIKRVLSRQQHQTLEGSENQRANICICFANMFRNFALSQYNLSKYFDGVIFLPFTKDTTVCEQIENDIISIMLKSKPGSFDEHEALPGLLQKIKQWKNEESDINQSAEHSHKVIQSLFNNFENIRFELDEEQK